jgi:hypothetical protein
VSASQDANYLYPTSGNRQPENVHRHQRDRGSQVRYEPTKSEKQASQETTVSDNSDAKVRVDPRESRAALRQREPEKIAMTFSDDSARLL